MAKGSLTVKFYLYDKVKPTHRGYPIYTRITYQRKKSRLLQASIVKRIIRMQSYLVLSETLVLKNGFFSQKVKYSI